MGKLSAVVQATINANAVAATRENFGIPAVYAYHTHYTDLYRIYSDEDGMTLDGFTQSEPAMLMAKRIFSQDPGAASIVVIRSTTKVSQTFNFKVTQTQVGQPVGISLLGPDGATHDVFLTGGATGDVDADASSLQALTPSGVTASNATDTVMFTVTAKGNMWYPTLVPNGDVFVGGIQGGQYTDTTVLLNDGSGVGTHNKVSDDLAATRLLESDWYGISTMYTDAHNIADVAQWAEANHVINGWVSADAANVFGTGSGIGHTLKAAGYNYSIGVATYNPADFKATGWMGKQFTVDPGSDTWAFAAIDGASVDDQFDETQTANLIANGMNYYSTTAGIQNMNDGIAASGREMDLTRGIDALLNDIQVSVFEYIVSQRPQKVPYTSKGCAAIGGVVSSVLLRYTANDEDEDRLLSGDHDVFPIVFVPAIGTISSSDKKARKLNKIKFTATAAGAIQSVVVQGTLLF